LDFRRHILYQLPGDQEFTVIPYMNTPFEELAAKEKEAQPALILAR
jgi:hypothetical protein